jgi:hypothetical protein
MSDAEYEARLLKLVERFTDQPNYLESLRQSRLLAFAGSGETVLVGLTSDETEEYLQLRYEVFYEMRPNRGLPRFRALLDKHRKAVSKDAENVDHYLFHMERRSH